MTGSLFLADGLILDPLGRSFALVLFYAALAWLPMRAAAALFQRHRLAGNPHARICDGAQDDACYRVGMKILPPL